MRALTCLYRFNLELCARQLFFAKPEQAPEVQDQQEQASVRPDSRKEAYIKLRKTYDGLSPEMQEQFKGDLEKLRKDILGADEETEEEREALLRMDQASLDELDSVVTDFQVEGVQSELDQVSARVEEADRKEHEGEAPEGVGQLEYAIGRLVFRARFDILSVDLVEGLNILVLQPFMNEQLTALAGQGFDNAVAAPTLRSYYEQIVVEANQRFAGLTPEARERLTKGEKLSIVFKRDQTGNPILTLMSFDKDPSAEDSDVVQALKARVLDKIPYLSMIPGLTTLLGKAITFLQSGFGKLLQKSPKTKAMVERVGNIVGLTPEQIWNADPLQANQQQEKLSAFLLPLLAATIDAILEGQTDSPYLGTKAYRLIELFTVKADRKMVVTLEAGASLKLGESPVSSALLFHVENSADRGGIEPGKEYVHRGLVPLRLVFEPGSILAAGTVFNANGNAKGIKFEKVRGVPV